MNRLSLARAVAAQTGQPIARCERVVGAFFSACQGFLEAGETVELRGHFCLMPTLRNRTRANNPRTGAPMIVLPHKTVTARFYYGRDWVREFGEQSRNPLLVEIEADMACHKHHYTARDKAR